MSKNITKANITSWIKTATVSATEPLIAQINELKIACAKRDAKIWHLESKGGLLERRLDDLDQYVKRPNLILDNVWIKRGETPASIKQVIMDEIERLQLDIDLHEVDRAHRIERPYIDDNGFRQQAVIVRFTGWGSRDIFYQARKQSRFFCRADLTPRREDILEKAKQKIIDHEHYADLVDYVFVDKNCILQACSTDGRIVGFSSDLEFDNLVSWLDTTTKPRNQICPQLAKMYDVNHCTNDDTKTNAKPKEQPKEPPSRADFLNRMRDASATRPISTDASEPRLNSASSQIASDISSLSASPPTSPTKPPSKL